MSRRPPRTVESAPSIAVLPFADMSPGQDQEYFSDGIAEELLNVLARVPGLKVAARRTSSFAFKGRGEDLRTIGGYLNVATVLEGSVRKAGTRLRVTAQLIDVKDGFHLWSETYERELDDVFAIQDEIAAAIVAALKVHLMGGAAAAPRVTPAASTAAYELYLLGRHHLARRTTVDIEAAADYFRRAVAADPGYVPAHAGYGTAYLLLDRQGGYGNLSLDEGLAESRPALDKALELDPGLAEGHAALGLWHSKQGDLPAALAAYRKAIGINPSHAMAYNWLFISLNQLDRYGEAMEALRRAVEMDPLALPANFNFATELMYRGNFAAARAHMEKFMAMRPDIPSGYRVIARGLTWQGRLAAAHPWLEKALALAPGNNLTRLDLGWLYLDLGLPGRAAPYLESDPVSLLAARGDYARAAAVARERAEGLTRERFRLRDAARAELRLGHDREARRLLELLAGGNLGRPGPLFAGLPVRAPDLALAYSRLGETRRAGELVARLRAFLDGRRDAGYAGVEEDYLEARTAAVAGDAAAAIAALNRAVESGYLWWAVPHDPVFFDLRDDPDFRAVMARFEARVAGERARFLAAEHEPPAPPE